MKENTRCACTACTGAVMRYSRRIAFLLAAVMLLTLITFPNPVYAASDFEYVLATEHDFITQYTDKNRLIVRDNDKETMYDYSGNKLSDSFTGINFDYLQNLWVATDSNRICILGDDGKIKNDFSIPENKYISYIGEGIVVLMDFTYVPILGYDWWDSYDGDVHILDYSGKELFSFDYAGHKNPGIYFHQYDLNFSDGMLIFRNSDGLCGAMDSNGDEVVKPQFQFITDFSHGYSTVRIDGKYGIIDKAGNLKTECIYDDISFYYDDSANKLYFSVIKDGKAGIIDSDSFRVTMIDSSDSMRITGIFPDDNIIKIWKNTGDSSYGAASMDGKIILDCIYDYISDPSEGLMAVQKKGNSLYAFANNSGNFITDFIYTDAADFSEGLAFVTGKNTGFIDKTGKMVIDMSNEKLGIINTASYFFSGGIAAISDSNGSSKYIDRTGKTILTSPVSDKWTSIKNFDDNVAIVSVGSVPSSAGEKYGVIRYAGTVSADTSETPSVTVPSDTTSADITIIKYSDWAAEEINAAKAAGIIPENLGNDYTTAISRENFCRLAFAMLEKTGKTLMTPDSEHPNQFSDTDSQYIYTLNRLGVIDGRGSGIFDPSSDITRQEAAKILVKLAGVMELPTSLIYYEYADQNTADEWAKPYISDSYALGVMQGVGNDNFSPKGTYTTEQSVLTMLRLYNKSNFK